MWRYKNGWYISTLKQGDTLDARHEVDYYNCHCPLKQITPPESKWNKCDDGIEPLPTVHKVYNVHDMRLSQTV